MPIRKQSGPQPLSDIRKPTMSARAAVEEDPDISDDDSYFSSKNEPEYLTRLTLAVANGRRRNRTPGRPFRHHIRAINHDEYTNDGPASPAPTVTTFSLKSGETGFRFLVTEESTKPRQPPAVQVTGRQRSNSGASDALPQIRPPQYLAANPRQADDDDLDSDFDSDDESLKSLEAEFLSPTQRRKAQYDGQRCVSRSERLRGFALRPSKSTVNVSSPALANKLGVPLSAELEVWM